MNKMTPYSLALGPVFFALRLWSDPRLSCCTWCCRYRFGTGWGKGTCRPLAPVCALRSAPFLRRCIRRPLLVHSTSCERPVRLAGGQPKRGEATPPGRQKIFPSVSGFFPSGRRADIGWKVEQLVRDDQWTSIHAGRARRGGFGNQKKKRNKAMCRIRFSIFFSPCIFFSPRNCK